MSEPDLAALFGSWDAVNWKLATGSNSLCLHPCGFLSVLVCISDDMSASIAYELASHDDVPLFAARQESQYQSLGQDQRIVGMRLPEPVPNLNSALTYRLYATSDRECIIKVLQLWYPIRENSK